MQTTIEGKFAPFEADDPDDLIGKEYHYVELVSGSRKIQLVDSGAAIGVLENRLEGGSDWTVRLLGCGGTYKVKTSGAIAHLASVKAASGGTAVDHAASGRALGTLISPAGGAASGDVIEVLDVLG